MNCLLLSMNLGKMGAGQVMIIHQDLGETFDVVLQMRRIKRSLQQQCRRD